MGREEIKLENIIKQIEIFRESATEQARFAKRDNAEGSQMCSEAMAHAYKTCIDLITKINDCKCKKCYPSTINDKIVKICFDCGSIHEYTNKQHSKKHGCGVIYYTKNAPCMILKQVKHVMDVMLQYKIL